MNCGGDFGIFETGVCSANTPVEYSRISGRYITHIGSGAGARTIEIEKNSDGSSWQEKSCSSSLDDRLEICGETFTEIITRKREKS